MLPMASALAPTGEKGKQKKERTRKKQTEEEGLHTALLPMASAIALTREKEKQEKKKKKTEEEGGHTALLPMASAMASTSYASMITSDRNCSCAHRHQRQKVKCVPLHASLYVSLYAPSHVLLPRGY